MNPSFAIAWAARTMARVWRLRGRIASLAIALLIAGAALVTLPLQVWPTEVEHWRAPAGHAPIAAGQEIPVFCLSAGRGAARCGLARVRADGAMRFTAYAGMDLPASPVPVLASAGMPLLWALADRQGRVQLRDNAASLAREVVASLQDLTRSATWQTEYRPRLCVLLRRISEQAWQAADTRRAFQALLAGVEPVVADSVTDELAPALAPYLADAVWQIVAANTTQVFSLIAGGPLDTSPLGAALDQAFRDPAAQRVLARLGPRIMALPQTELLAERLVANLAAAAQHEPEIIELVGRIATDQRLGAPLGRVRDDADAFVREFGQVLWGLGGSASLNSLAGLAMRSTLADVPQPMILLLDRAQERALRGDLPSGSIPLLIEDAT